MSSHLLGITSNQSGAVLMASKAGQSQSLLQVSDLSVSYGSRRGQGLALTGINFELAAGDAVGVLGESGGGKTTLALTLLSLLPHAAQVTAGSIV